MEERTMVAKGARPVVKGASGKLIYQSVGCCWEGRCPRILARRSGDSRRVARMGWQFVCCGKEETGDTDKDQVRGVQLGSTGMASTSPTKQRMQPKVVSQ